MKEQIILNIEKREDSAGKLRSEGKVPAVFYGPQEESTPITMSRSEFERVWNKAGESTIIILKGLGDDKEALIKDVQWHPLTDQVVHVDFYVFERGKKLTVSVPLEFVGEAPAEKLGGNVNKAVHELEIEVRPSEIPQVITVDLTKLTDMDSVISVGDLDLPESAEPTMDSSEAVASMVMAVEEDLSAPVEEEVQEEGQESSEQTESGEEPKEE